MRAAARDDPERNRAPRPRLSRHRAERDLLTTAALRRPGPGLGSRLGTRTEIRPRPGRSDSPLSIRKPLDSSQFSDGETRTRTGDHHDFQSWTEISLTRLKVLHSARFTSVVSESGKSAICICCSRIQAPNRASVPKRQACLHVCTAPSRQTRQCRRAPGPALLLFARSSTHQARPIRLFVLVQAGASDTRTEALARRPRRACVDGPGRRSHSGLLFRSARRRRPT